MSPTLAAGPGGHSFCADIAKLLTAEGVGVPGLRSAAAQACDRFADFADWLAELRADPAAARDVAARSYWHPNGFAKLVLYSSDEPEFRLRLHVWPAVTTGLRLGESNPHSHRWEFASVVAVGDGMHMVEYVETEQGGKPYRRHRYGADPADRAALVADGSVRLARTRSPHVYCGQTYSCDTAVVHTVVPIGTGVTATLVVQGPQLTPVTVVYREPGLSDDQPNGVLTDADFRSLADAVLAAYRAAR